MFDALGTGVGVSESSAGRLAEPPVKKVLKNQTDAYPRRA